MKSITFCFIFHKISPISVAKNNAIVYNEIVT